MGKKIIEIHKCKECVYCSYATGQYSKSLEGKTILGICSKSPHKVVLNYKACYLFKPSGKTL